MKIDQVVENINNCKNINTIGIQTFINQTFNLQNTNVSKITIHYQKFDNAGKINLNNNVINTYFHIYLGNTFGSKFCISIGVYKTNKLFSKKVNNICSYLETVYISTNNIFTELDSREKIYSPIFKDIPTNDIVKILIMDNQDMFSQNLVDYCSK